MAPHYCLTPGNPDITGIGVRISLYAQSMLIVIISSIARWQGKAPDSVAALWRIQFYTVLAFIIAGVIQRASGQLSLFHETSALHLGVLTVWSALVGLITEPKLESSKMTAVFQSRRGDTAYITTSHSATAQILVACGYGILVPLMCILVMADGVCHATPDLPDSDYLHITWIMLFNIPLHGTSGQNLGIFSLNDLWFPIVPILFIAMGVLFVCLMKCVFPWRSVRAIPCGSVLGYVLFWVEEVVAIERSLQANPSLNENEENAWGFGQIIPLVLLIPFFELINEQLRGKEEEPKSIHDDSDPENQALTAERYRLRQARESDTSHSQPDPLTLPAELTTLPQFGSSLLVDSNEYHAAPHASR